MSRMSRIHGIKSGNPNAPKGNITEEGGNANLRYWENYASKNSYHGPSSQESGTDRLGTKDKNHSGGTFLPKVRRDA